MPEGDTVFRTARRLDQALAGQRLLDADLRWPSLATVDLRGAEVRDVTARGKHILTRFDTDWTLHSHLRMDGIWWVQRTPPDAGSQRHPAAAVPARMQKRDVRAVLVGPEWTCVGLQLGMLDYIRTADERTLVGHLGPDLLDPAFDAPRAVANLAASDTTIGAALLDQRNLAGIGTLWSCETLFIERVNPWTSTADLAVERLQRIVARAQRLIVVNAEYEMQSSTGERRQGRTKYVHARSGRACRRCGEVVRVSQIGPPTRERPMFYCPRCQGGLAPTDDGRPEQPLGSRHRR